MKHAVKVLLLAFCTMLPLASAPAADQTVYYYCYSSKPPYGAAVYFSEVFPASLSVYHVGISNAFDSFVAARIDPDAQSGASCMGPFDDHQEAENKLNDHIGERRRAGKDVVLTRWSYRGD